MVLSGDPERLYMAFVTAIGVVSAGGRVYMFFTMDGLKGVTEESGAIMLPDAKPLRFYVDSLQELSEDGEVELAACEFGMQVKQVHKDKLIPNVKVSGVVEFAFKSSESKSTYVF